MVQVQQHCGRTVTGCELKRSRDGRMTPLVFPPAVDAADNESGQHHENSEDQSNWNPERRLGNALFGFVNLVLFDELRMRAVREVVFGEERFLIEPKIPRDGADEPAIEDASREFFPVFVFESLQIAGSDAGGRSDFFRRHFPQFPFAFQAFPEDSPGHVLSVRDESIRGVTR